MARSYSPIPLDAPKLPPLTALVTLARVGRFLRPYRRQVVYAAVALLAAAAAVLTMGQGLKYVVDRGLAAGSGADLDRTLAARSRASPISCIADSTVSAISLNASFNSPISSRLPAARR